MKIYQAPNYCHYHHTINTFDIDPNQTLSPVAFMRLCQNAAMQHSIQLNVSAFDLAAINLTWVLVKKTINFHQLPTLGESVRIITNPSHIDRFMVYRDFRLFNESDDLLAQASSTWLLMSTITRKMAKVPAVVQSEFTPIPLECCLPKPSARLIKTEKKDYKGSFNVGWYDVDFNNHLSNVLYVKWMLEPLPVNLLKTSLLKEFSIQYKQEATLGDVLQVNIEQLSPKHFRHEIFNPSQDKLLALAESYW